MNRKPAEYIVDPPLGRLAKWLRIMGISAHYQTMNNSMEVEKFLSEGRILLTKNRSLKKNFRSSILITSDKIQFQLKELKEKGLLPETSENWFKRCIKCNIPLQKVNAEDVRGRIPEYIISQNTEGTKHCPSCKRYFWPGSHRKRIIEQLADWKIISRKHLSTT